MREIQANDITQAVAKMCQDANFYLGNDVIAALKKCASLQSAGPSQGCANPRLYAAILNLAAVGRAI